MVSTLAGSCMLCHTCSSTQFLFSSSRTLSTFSPSQNTCPVAHSPVPEAVSSLGLMASWFSFYPFTSSGFLWGSVLLLLGYSVFVLFQRFCFLVRNSPPGFGNDSAHVISILLTTAWTSLLSWGLLIYHTFPLNLQQIIPHSPYIHHLS